MILNILAVTAALLLSLTNVHAYDAKLTISDLNVRLTSLGAPRVNGTDKSGDKTVPAIYFGERKINNNYDVVDALRKAHNATATIFVKDGEEYVRVSTNVLTAEGKRAVGTTLAHNAAYESIGKGAQFCGLIDVLGTAFDACYNPIKDSSGKTIGIFYVGHKK